MSTDPDGKSPFQWWVTTLIALLAAGGGVVAWLDFISPSPSSGRNSHSTVMKNTSVGNVPSTSHGSSGSKNQDSLQFTPPEVNINWGDVPEYFDLRDIEFKKGLGNWSELTFSVKSKKDFRGTMIVQFFDSDGIEKCGDKFYDSNYYSREGCNISSVYLKTRADQSRVNIWHKDQPEIGLAHIPYNTTAIEFKFIQTD